jgi:predicted DCC family thiol-disulfide oxidoreductase YuxK
VLVFYDSECDICQRGIAWLRRLDRHERTECLPLDAAERAGLDPQACARRIHVLTPERRILAGWDAVAYLARLFPLTWLIGALGALPGFRNLGRLLYGCIANHRYTLSRRRGAVCRRMDADG